MWKIQALATKDGRIFMTLHDNHLSTSFYLKPEEAVEIGRIGRMVQAQVSARATNENSQQAQEPENDDV